MPWHTRQTSHACGRVSLRHIPRSRTCLTATPAHLHEQPRKLVQWQAELLGTIASIQNLFRPGRREPRATKRRRKTHQLLTPPVISSRKSNIVIATAQLLN